MRPNAHKERLDLWQDDVRMARRIQQPGPDWFAVTGMLIVIVSAMLGAWMLYKSVPMVMRLLVAVVD